MVDLSLAVPFFGRGRVVSGGNQRGEDSGETGALVPVETKELVELNVSYFLFFRVRERVERFAQIVHLFALLRVLRKE